MTYQTALEIAKYLQVISQNGFDQLAETHRDLLAAECPASFINTIESLPRPAVAQ